MDKLGKNFSVEVDEVLGALGALLKAKNQDYGGSVFQSCDIAPGLSVEMAMFVRVGDKINRLKSLLGSENVPAVQESIDDTLADLAGYLVCLLIWRRRNQNDKNET